MELYKNKVIMDQKNTDIKKLIYTVIATGGLVAGGFTIEKRLNCDYTLIHKDQEICIDKEVKEAIESRLSPNSGFGGVRFSGK